MRTANEILEDFRQTFNAVKAEEETREQIRTSDEFQAYHESIDSLMAEQDKLLSLVPDTSEEYGLDKAELIAYMQENNETQLEEFKAKGRKQNTVDTYSLLRLLEGDIDALMVIVSVKQKDLIEFIKANDRKDLKKCVIEEGFKITDIFQIEE